MNQNNQQSLNRQRVNHQIRVFEVRVVLDDGSSPGVMNTRDALQLAKDQGLDLIEINPKASPPVCLISDLGKLKYSEKKKQQEAKKKQPKTGLKEISFHANTAENDLTHKLNQAKDFLLEGNSVKFSVRFRGREMAHHDLGREKIYWFLQQLETLIAPNSQIVLEGKVMSAMVFPVKKNK